VFLGLEGFYLSGDSETDPCYQKGFGKRACREEINKTGQKQVGKQKLYSIEDIWILYFRNGFSKRAIAKKLGIACSTVGRIFDRMKWPTRPRPTKADPREALRLRDMGCSDKEIGRILRVSVSTVKNYLREFGERRPCYTDKERNEKRKENSTRSREKAKKMRNALFGSQCSVCGVSGKRRKIAIHNKEFSEHDMNALWRISFLQNANPDEWAALCVMCHRGVHWAHDDLAMEWEDVENLLKRKESKIDRNRQEIEPVKVETSSESRVLSSFDGNAQDLRNVLFGSNCYFCGPIPEEKNRIIHRKDGQLHRRSSLWTKEFLLKLNRSEWEMLCQKHHRYVHWAMKRLGMSWDDIEKAFRNII
jgi:predicted transcriptional regulator